MNKKLYLILLAVMLVCFCFIFSACGDKICNHVYDNSCDTTCNACGGTRNITHTYDNDKDEKCNVCGFTRNVIHTHTYDNICDPDCNTCSEFRTIEHIYTNSCDFICNLCGNKRVVTHTYDNDCDTICNICGETRNVVHLYDNDCDTDCNICNEHRETSHVYEFPCSTKCVVCHTNIVNDVEHTYDNNCDSNCNICNEVRIAVHIDNNNNNECDICNCIIESEKDEEKIAAFIECFNNYLNSVHNIKRENFPSSNTKFSNIITSGSINVYIDEISSISIYDKFKHYTYKDGSELFIVQTEDGEYSISHYNGEYEILDSNLYNKHYQDNIFQMLTRSDVFINENGTFSISSNYMTQLYKAWFNSDIEYSWSFGTHQISYYDINPWLDYANFVTEITCDETGAIISCNIVLKDDTKEYYHFTFETGTSKTCIHIVMDTGVQTNVDFIYNKSTNGSAEFNLEIVDVYGTHTLVLATDVTTNLSDFVSNAELDDALADAKEVFNNVLAMSNKYNNEYTMNGTCSLVAFYDDDYNMYAIFEYNNGKYHYIGCTFTLDDINACIVSVNENNSLIITEHNLYERVNETLKEKYSDTYTIINGSNNIEIVLVYDTELNVYALFVKTGDFFQYSGCLKEIPPEYIGLISVGTIDLLNKTITIS